MRSNLFNRFEIRYFQLDTIITHNALPVLLFLQNKRYGKVIKNRLKYFWILIVKVSGFIK
jgi:hypothetical protein